MGGAPTLDFRRELPTHCKNMASVKNVTYINSTTKQRLQRMHRKIPLLEMKDVLQHIGLKVNL
jgi:hypothetical protein